MARMSCLGFHSQQLLLLHFSLFMIFETVISCGMIVYGSTSSPVGMVRLIG